MAMYDLEVKIGADSSQLQKSFKEAKKSTEEVQQAAEQLDVALSDETAAGAFSEAVGEASAAASAALEQVREEAAETAAAVNEAVNSAGRSDSSADTASGAYADAVDEQMAAVDELNSALEETGELIDDIDSSTDELLPEAKKGIDDTADSVDDLGGSLGKTVDEAEKADKSVRRIAGAAVAITVVRKAAQELLGCFRAYANYESAVMRVSDIFGQSADAVENFAERNAAALGMSRTAAYEYAATFGNLFRSITTDQEENSRVTIAMLTTSAAIASKTGRTVSDVMERIRSGLLGNTEAIEDLGIFVNAAMLQTTDAFRRMADGRSWEQLEYHEQQQIRTLAILEQANKQFGGEITQNTAMSVSAYQAAVDDLKVALGGLASGALTPAIQVLTSFTRAVSGCVAWVSSLSGTSRTYLRIALILAAGIPAVTLAVKGLALAQAGLHAVQALLIPQTLTYATALKALLGWAALAAVAFALLHNIFGSHGDTDSAAESVDDYSSALKTAQENASSAAGSVNDVTKAAKALGDEVKRSLAGFDELNTLSNSGGNSLFGIDVDKEALEEAADLTGAFSDMDYDITFDTNAESVKARIKKALGTMWTDIRSGYSDWQSWWHGLGEDMYTGINDGDWEPVLTRLNEKVEALFGSKWTSFWKEAGGNMYEGIHNGDWTPLLEQFNRVVQKLFGSEWTSFWENVGDDMYEGIQNGDWTPLLEDAEKRVRLLFGDGWADFWEQVGEDMHKGIESGDWTQLLSDLDTGVRRIFGVRWTDFWENRGQDMHGKLSPWFDKVKAAAEKIKELIDKITSFNVIDSLSNLSDKLGFGEFSSGSKSVLKMLTGNFGGAAKDGLSWLTSKLPGHAMGGIVTRPEIAMIGENGAEAVIPLENNTGWIDSLAARIAELIPAGGGSDVPVILDGREVGRFCIRAVEDDRRRKGN